MRAQFLVSVLTRTDPELLARIDIGYVKKIHEKELKAMSKKRREEVDALKRNNELRRLCLKGDCEFQLSIKEGSLCAVIS